jgi:hypothetical protein
MICTKIGLLFAWDGWNVGIKEYWVKARKDLFNFDNCPQQLIIPPFHCSNTPARIDTKLQNIALLIK